MADPEPTLQAHTLVVVGVADALVNELLCDLGSQVAAVRLGDQAQHHVQGGGSAGAGEPRAVDFESLAGDIEAGKVLTNSVEVLPMHRAEIGRASCRERVCQDG